MEELKLMLHSSGHQYRVYRDAIFLDVEDSMGETCKCAIRYMDYDCYNIVFIYNDGEEFIFNVKDLEEVKFILETAEY